MATTRCLAQVFEAELYFPEETLTPCARVPTAPPIPTTSETAPTFRPALPPPPWFTDVCVAS